MNNLSEEIWKDAVYCYKDGKMEKLEGLLVSNFGNCKTKDRYVRCKGGYRMSKGKTLNKEKCNSGYYRFSFCHKHYLIHRLVYSTFKGDIPTDMNVNHIDENPANNKLSNLNLMTHKDNINWGTRNRRMAISQGKPILQIDLNGNIIKEWYSQGEAARVLNTSQGNIGSALHGRYKTCCGYIWKFKEGV